MDDRCQNSNQKTDHDAPASPPPGKSRPSDSPHEFKAVLQGIVVHQNGQAMDMDITPQMCQMLGYSRDELKTINGFDLISPKHQEMIHQHIQSGFEGPYRINVHRKDGSEMLMEVQAKNIQIEGKFFRVATFHDLTEQKKLRQQLAESEKKYRDLYAKAQIPLFRTQISDGKLLACNEVMARFLGYKTIQECLADYDALSRYDSQKQREEVVRLLQKNKRLENYELKGRTKNGQILWISVTAEIFPERGYIEGVITDITALKLLTKTERGVLRLVLKGKTNREIAAETNRSIRTIEDHRAHIMKKLGTNNLVELAQKALSMGFNP